MSKNASWFYLDDDGDGLLNGPSDWDTDGDGMPDGFEYCYSHIEDSPSGNISELLDPSDPTDGFDDWDKDDLNNLEEYQSANIFGPKISLRLGALIPIKIVCQMAGKLIMA